MEMVHVLWQLGTVVVSATSDDGLQWANEIYINIFVDSE
jgi:hypothetical protein